MSDMLSDLTYLAQFELLRVWIGTLEAEELQAQSVLPAWTVAELIGHLMGTGTTISALIPAEPGAEPMSIAQYVANYAGSSDQIASIAKDLTNQAGTELLAGLDRSHHEAQENLARLGGLDSVVVGRRGPILLSNFLDTRLIELVVHSGDLSRSLPHRQGPQVLPSASRQVVSVLRELLTARASDPVAALAAASALDPIEFIELATGRVPPADDLAPALAAALPLF